MRRILKDFLTKHAKPYQIDYRKPDDADEKLKKLGHIDPDDIIDSWTNQYQFFGYCKIVIIQKTSYHKEYDKFKETNLVSMHSLAGVIDIC